MTVASFSSVIATIISPFSAIVWLRTITLSQENEATVKRFYKEKARYRLQPENSSMDPIYLEQVSVLGKVVGLFREM